MLIYRKINVKSLYILVFFNYLCRTNIDIYMAKEYFKPDYIFESSWEVCNKVGGIYTVLSSRSLLVLTVGRKRNVPISRRTTLSLQNGNGLQKKVIMSMDCLH